METEVVRVCASLRLSECERTCVSCKVISARLVPGPYAGGSGGSEELPTLS